jgi:hypothetical protein
LIEVDSYSNTGIPLRPVGAAELESASVRDSNRFPSGEARTTTAMNDGNSANQPTGPAADIIRSREQKLQAEIDGIEKSIHELETVYVGQAECTAFGSVLKGLEGFLTSKNAQNRNKVRTFKLEDRLFSLSSVQSQSSREMQAQQDLEQAAQLEGRRARTASLYGGAKG